MPCALTRSLIKPPADADFNLFHGVPAVWESQAAALSNAIAITVWETETMPAEWQAALRRAADVWVPSSHNQAVFEEGLGRPAFRLPHPYFPRDCAWTAAECSRFLDVADHEFVVYSIFEWQERKNPEQVIHAYLLAFDGNDRTALVIKSNPSARERAQETLAKLRERTRSTARVRLRCETWDETQIAALHARGNCYISLHSGEGWCYPLYEAACAGKAIVATGYSGPLDYLDPDAHALVRYQLAPVQQRYRFYNPEMLWAEPDSMHAAECLRAVYECPRESASKTTAAGERLREAYSVNAVGRMARERLLELLHTNRRSA